MMADNYKVFDKTSIVDSDGISFKGHSFKRREIVLGIVAIIALVVCVILAIVLATNKAGGGGGSGPQSCGQKGAESCFSPLCMKTSASVSESMDGSANPCDDFYQYACGSWSKRNPIKPDRNQMTPAWNIYYRNQEKLRRLMETPASLTSSKYETKAKDYFGSCTDHYGKMKLQGTPFLEQVLKKSGGWWLLGTWNGATYNLQDALKKTHVDFWTNALFTFSLRTDWENWNNYAIEIDLSGTGISWLLYTRPTGKPFIDAYKKFMRTVAGYLLRDSGVKLNETEKNARLDTFVNDVITVEAGLANATYYSEPTLNPHAHESRMKLKDLQTLTDAIDWVDFFKYMFDRVTEETHVVVLEKDYISKMGDMVKDLGQDKSRILNNYMTWRLAHKYVQDLSWDYIHANREFYVAMTNEAEFLGTWRYCMGLVDRDMGEAVSSLFVRDHFSDNNKNKSVEIVNYLRDALVDSVKNSQWMDKQTRNVAALKLKETIIKMGYPAFMMKNDRLDEMYMSLQINRSDYFANRLSMNKFYKTDWNRRLNKGTDREEWTYNTYAVVAEYYNPWRELIVPAGLLQWPLYDYQMPHYVNFGALGSILGHNLVHAIDKIGSQYKVDGSHFGNWWTNKTKEQYSKVKKCVVDAYSNKSMGPYTLSFGPPKPISVPVDPVGYAPEAFAETSGVRLAFRAFKDWEAKNKRERTAPGLSLTNEQMFFVSYAQSNCYNRNGNEAYMQASRGVLQENMRVNMALSQVKEFRQAFSCPADSRMVAKKICTMY